MGSLTQRQLTVDAESVRILWGRAMAQSDEGGCSLLFLAGIGALFFFGSGSSYANAVWYAVAFGVSPSIVETEVQPKDCDFLHAPLGDKGCKYKAVATSYNADGIPLNGDLPPKFGKNTGGRNVISYDGGKNWDWYVGTSDKPSEITKVVVSWRRETT